MQKNTHSIFANKKINKIKFAVRYAITRIKYQTYGSLICLVPVGKYCCERT